MIPVCKRAEKNSFHVFNELEHRILPKVKINKIITLFNISVYMWLHKHVYNTRIEWMFVSSRCMFKGRQIQQMNVCTVYRSSEFDSALDQRNQKKPKRQLIGFYLPFSHCFRPIRLTPSPYWPPKERNNNKQGNGLAYGFVKRQLTYKELQQFYMFVIGRWLD